MNLTDDDKVTVLSITCEAAEILDQININFKIGKLYLLYLINQSITRKIRIMCKKKIYLTQYIAFGISDWEINYRKKGVWPI